MTPFRVIKTTAVSVLSEVILYEETIQKVKDGHPEVPAELPSIEHAVEQAIVNPTYVEKSYKNSYVFVDTSSTNSSGDPLRVPVKVVTGTSGRVKTFFFGDVAGTPEIVSKSSNDE